MNRSDYSAKQFSVSGTEYWDQFKNAEPVLTRWPVEDVAIIW